MTALAGRAVIVTGAAQGLGRAIALACAAEGASVLVADVDGPGAQATAEAITSAGAHAEAHVGSVAEWDRAAQLVARCRERFGAVDGLVNNAARFHTGPAIEETEASLTTIVQANVLGTMFCSVHALRAMRELGRGGAIVNLTSTARFGRRGMAAYAATKGAVASATFSWALEAAEYGVRVNAVAPRAMTRMVAIGRDSAPDHAPPEHVAPVVVYLLSAQAGAVTGQVAHFDGRGLALGLATGLTASVHQPEPWTPGQVAQAFAGPLAQALQPVGWTGGAVDGGPATPVAGA